MRLLQRRDARATLLVVVLVSLIVLDWQLCHAYRGVFHDAGLYILQGLAALHPQSVGHDVFLRFDSQARSYSWETFASRHRNAMWAAIGLAAVAGLHQLVKRLNV